MLSVIIITFKMLWSKEVSVNKLDPYTQIVIIFLCSKNIQLNQFWVFSSYFQILKSLVSSSKATFSFPSSSFYHLSPSESSSLSLFLKLFLNCFGPIQHLWVSETPLTLNSPIPWSRMRLLVKQGFSSYYSHNRLWFPTAMLPDTLCPISELEYE